MSTMQIDLQTFCNSESTRWAMVEPFVQDGWLCATDGAIAVQVRDDGPDTPPLDGKRQPNVRPMFTAWSEGWNFAPWPEAEYIKRSLSCRKCDGTGADKHHECPECEGDGLIDCEHCGHEYECDRCDGEGTVKCGKCSACGGTKEAVQDSHIIVGGLAISYKYDQKIRTLGQVSYHVHNDYVFFRFDGGRGIVSPLNVEH